MNGFNKKYGLQDKITFGKHRDKDLNYVLMSDFTYIKWAVENNIITLLGEANDLYKEKLDAFFKRKKEESSKTIFDLWKNPNFIKLEKSLRERYKENGSI